MSNLLSNLLSQAKKSELSHGIHEDCILLEVSNKTRKTKDGNPITKNGYTKFGKLNDKGEVTAEKEISWWDIDHNSEYAGSNLFEQLTQMVNLLDCLVDPEVVEKKFDAMLEDQEIETKADLEEAAKSKSGLKEVITAINEIYVELLKDKTNDKENTLRVKLSYDSKGRNVQVPGYGDYVEPMSKEETDLSFSQREQEFAAKSRVTATPGLGSGKSPKKVSSI